MCQFVHVGLLQVCYGSLLSHWCWCSSLQTTEDCFAGVEVHNVNVVREEMFLYAANLLYSCPAFMFVWSVIPKHLSNKSASQPFKVGKYDGRREN